MPNVVSRSWLRPGGVVGTVLVVLTLGHCASVVDQDGRARESCIPWIEALEEWRHGPGHGKYPPDLGGIALPLPDCALTSFYQVSEDRSGYALLVRAAPVFGMTGFQFYSHPPGTWSRRGL